MGLWVVFRADAGDILQPLSIADAYIPHFSKPGCRPVHWTLRKHGRAFPDVCPAVASPAKYYSLGALWGSHVRGYGLEQERKHQRVLLYVTGQWGSLFYHRLVMHPASWRLARLQTHGYGRIPFFHETPWTAKS